MKFSFTQRISPFESLSFSFSFSSFIKPSMRWTSLRWWSLNEDKRSNYWHSRCQRCLVDGIWSKILTTNIEFIFRWIITMYRIKFYTFIFVQFLVIFLYIKNVFAVYLLSNKYKYLTFNIIVTLLIKKKYNYFGIILTRFFIFNVDFHVWYTYCVVSRIVSTYNGINSYLDQ